MWKFLTGRYWPNSQLAALNITTNVTCHSGFADDPTSQRRVGGLGVVGLIDANTPFL
jgi:hypothetical protein